MTELFTWWGRTVVKIRWLVLAAAALVAAVGAGWGSGVFGALAGGGFDDPRSESARAAERITTELGRRDADLVVLYSSDAATVDDPSFRDPVVATLTALRQRPEVANVAGLGHTPAAGQQQGLVSADRHATYAVITLRATGDDGKQAAFDAVRPALTAPGVNTQVGGVVAFQAAADRQTERDIARGEMFAMPIVLILLIVLFGGLVAAGLPLLIGGLAILGALTLTRLLTLVTDVSTFAVNTITLLGLGMAIDYSLLMISRFREELRAGTDVRAAIARTVATSGRTVLVSGLTVTFALASLLIFPQVFLRSMGLGGMAAVLVAMLGALTVLPAALAVLGTRIDALRIPPPRRRRTRLAPGAEYGPDRGRGHTARGSGERGAWARLAHAVMGRPVRYLVAVVAILAVLALPLGHARFSGADERVLPAGTEARVVTERITAGFPDRATAPIDTLVEGASTAQVNQLAARIRALPAVTAAQVTASGDRAALISVSYTGPRTGDAAHDSVRAIRDLPTPDGVDVLVGGRTAADVDRLDSLGARLPLMAAIMAAVTLVLLFLAFGSVLLPIKAVAMNLISLGASFGVVVWVFQDGNLSGLLGFTPTGFIEPTIPILLLAVLFGLATDYEVFLLSRVREAWDATGDNTAAVAAGMQRTGRIITAAALLLIVVVAAFTTGQVTFAKMIGVGMITAITVDAALVRTLLVPATMRLLGHRNWWAPRPLRAAYHRYGIHEPATPAPHRPGTAAQADITRLTGIDVSPSLSGPHHREGGPGPGAP